MKIFLSPAKTLDYETALPTTRHTQPQFLTATRQVQKVLKKQKPKDLSELMDISQKLADLNWKRNKDWKTPFTKDNARPAMYAFAGDVYLGLEAYSLEVDKLDSIQEKVRILSGLYGMLRPLDLIQPYRLEMGTNLQVGDEKNLYGFWKDKVTKAVNKELKKGEMVLNLASKEYFDVIDAKAIKGDIITPEFKDYKNGKLSIISFYAKKARGSMVRFIIDKSIEKLDDLKSFDYEGYALDANLSIGNTLVFTR